MKFSYTALSAENKKLTGLLEAQSLDLAKEELHKMGVSILSVQEISDEEYERLKAEGEKAKAEGGITTFAFRAIDPTGKEIEGTIDSKSDEAALKRLLTEYRFLVKELYPFTASADERKAAEEKLKNLLVALKSQGVEFKTRAKKTEYEEEEVSAIDTKITAEIDKIITTAKKILQENSDLYSTNRFADLQKTLGELERVRTSNNVKHIGEVSNKLYKLLSHPDTLTPAEAQGRTSYQDLLKEFQGASIIRQEGDFYRKSALLKQLNHLWQNISSRIPLLKHPAVPAAEEPPAKPTKESPFVRLKNQLKKQREKAISKTPEVQAPKPAKKSHDFTPFFAELNHFVGWLLTFYLLYFLVVDFSLEKGIGLSRDFVFRTLKTPLLLQITFFILTTHFLLHLKLRHFQKNFLGSLFLMLFGYGLYAFVLLNT